MTSEKERSALRERAFPRKVTIVWALVVAALLIAGAPFLFDRLVNGLGMADTTNRVPWGLWVVAYTWFSGLAGGLFLISSLAYLFRLRRFMPVARMALAGSVVFLLVSMLLIGLDLGVLGNAAGTLLFFHWTSALSWEIKLYLVFSVIALAQLVLVLRNGSASLERRGNKNLGIRVLAGLGVALSFVGPPGGTGMFFATVKARGFWNDGITAVLFYVVALATAAAFLLVAYSLLVRLRHRKAEDDTVRGLTSVLAIALVASAFVGYFQLATGIAGGATQSGQAVQALLFGSLAPLFWIGQVGVGLALAGALAVDALRSGRIGSAVAAGIATLVGAFALRYGFVVAGFSVPLLDGLPAPVYTPNFAEVMVVVFAFGMAAGLFGLIVRWLPLEAVGASEGMAEAAAPCPVTTVQEEVYHGTAA